jgi:virulence-associated protein VapD
MFAIAFDLVVEETLEAHPRGLRQAYSDVEATLSGFGFARVQGSVYLTENEDLTKLVGAMNALKALHWFPASVRDIRAFRVEQWSDFTGFMKETN